MKCSFCNKKAIYFDGENAYCREHFIKYFEEKVLETIERYKLIEDGDKVGVAVSGGKDSISLLYFLSKYKDYFKIKVYGIHIDEGIKGYREILTKYLKKVSEKFGWELKIYRFKDFFGVTLDEAVRILKEYKPCTICGIWRRWLMNYAAKDLNLTKIATAHNMNDEVQTIIMNILENNFKDYLKGGPKVGIIDSDFIPRIKPFYFLTEKETTIYSLINNINPPWAECPYIRNQTRDIVRRELYKLEGKMPGFHRKFIENYLEDLKILKERYKKRIKLKKCKICGFPTSREICRACEIKTKINKFKFKL